MSQFKGGERKENQNAPGATTAEAYMQQAAMLYQRGDLSGSMQLYKQIADRFPQSQHAGMARTMIAGMQKERIRALWETALDERSRCNAKEALKLYQRIIQESADSPEAASAQSEIRKISELQPLWAAALASQAEGSETKALDLYRKIVDTYEGTPEAENAGFMMAIIHQNQLMPRGEMSQDYRFEKNSPEKLVSHLLTHKKAVAAPSGGKSPESAKEEETSSKFESLWIQADTLEKEGHSDEAEMLYRKIIDSSKNGHRVRDAKYRLEKIKAINKGVLKSYDNPSQWGLTQERPSRVRSLLGWKGLVFILIPVVILCAAGMAFYRIKKPAAWVDIVEQAKKSIVVVRTAAGAGTGFLISPNGNIITNAQVVGKEKEVEVRLYSGALKKAEVVKTGSKLLDVAVLKIEGTYDQYLPMQGTDECQEGMELRVLGAPSGVEYFITKGIVSHCNVDRDGVRYIQTESSISAGNSGGPCLNNFGKVVGLSTPHVLGDNAKSWNVILPSNVVKDFMEGRLTTLEETLLKKEEEMARESEESKKKVYADIENINKKLLHVASMENTAYLKKVSNLLDQRMITSRQADIMVEQVKYGPSGSIPMTQWVQSIAMTVAKGEISEESAIMLIKNQFKVN